MLMRARVYGLAALLLLAMWVAIREGQSQPTAPRFKGEYFATKNSDPICLPFALNLNDSRRLDFDVCDPRLSDKYPQFTRPVWEEIPFDLALAETIFKNPPTSPPESRR